MTAKQEVCNTDKVFKKERVCYSKEKYEGGLSYVKGMNMLSITCTQLSERM